ncbi:MAG: S41 family peptidase [Lachnospiraceae bacterium]|nr:S41 family peptidase [Lachnospiraceae bacterium]
MEEQFNKDSDMSEENISQEGKKLRSSFKRGVLAGASCVLAVLALLLLGGLIFLKNTSSDFLDSNTRTKIKLIAQMIDKYYYKEVDDETKEEGLYRGLVESTGDKYSTYYSSDELADVMKGYEGHYEGIGVTLTQDKESGKVLVINVIKDTPGEKAGILAGDEIISADSFTAASMDLTNFVSKIKGEEGTKVKITGKHANGKTYSVDVPREKIVYPTVEYQMLTDDIGLISISGFDEETKNSFDKAVKELKRSGMKAVIYDLRTNPGGLVKSVTEILDEILPKGVLVYLLDKEGVRKDFTSDDEHQLDIPSVVLISQSTASSGEIFAGAMRDFDKATLIGETTYGKGIVQDIKPLPDGSAIKLTIETYYTPKGECIHEKGIKPDIELAFQYNGDKKSLKYDYLKDVQVQKAIKVLENEKR